MKLAGPFAVGTFSVPGQAPFPGLVADGQVRDLAARRDFAVFAGADPLSTRSLLEHWDEALPRLRSAAAAAPPRNETSHLGDMSQAGAMEAETCDGPRDTRQGLRLEEAMPKEARVALLLAAAACLMAVTVEWVIAELQAPPQQ